MDQIKEALKTLGSTFEKFKKANDDRLTEIEAKGYASGVIEEKVAKLDSALTKQRDIADGLQAKLDEEKSRGDKLETAFNRTDGDKGGGKDDSEYRTKFARYMKSGNEIGLRELEAKTLSVGSDADGGYTVRPEVSDNILKTITETTPVRRLASVMSIGSDSFEMPRRTSGATSGGWVGETAPRPETGTPKLGILKIEAHEQFAEPHATQKLLDDSAINIEQWLAEEVRDVFARTENTSFMTGAGLVSPRGLLTYPAGTGLDQIEQVVSGSAAAITADGLIDLQDALKEFYQAGSSWLMNRSTVTAIRKLKATGSGDYMWQPGLRAGETDLLLGKPIVRGADMPAIGANSLSLIYGDFKRGYRIVDRVGIRVLRDPLTSKPFIKFYTTKRSGGALIQGEALKIQKISA